MGSYRGQAAAPYPGTQTGSLFSTVPTAGETHTLSLSPSLAVARERGRGREGEREEVREGVRREKVKETIYPVSVPVVPGNVILTLLVIHQNYSQYPALWQLGCFVSITLYLPVCLSFCLSVCPFLLNFLSLGHAFPFFHSVLPVL